MLAILTNSLVVRRCICDLIAGFIYRDPDLGDVFLSTLAEVDAVRVLCEVETLNPLRGFKMMGIKRIMLMQFVSMEGHSAVTSEI